MTNKNNDKAEKVKAEPAKTLVRQLYPEFTDFTLAKEVAADTLEKLKNLQSAPEKGILEDIFPSPGLMAGTLAVVCSTPSQGKTAYLANIVSELARTGRCVAVFLPDITAQDFMARILALRTGTSYRHLKPEWLAGENWSKIAEAGEQFSRSGVYFSQRTRMDTQDIINDMVRLAHQLKKTGLTLDAVVVDSLNYMHDDSCNNPLDLYGLRQTAQSLKLAVLCALGLEEGKRIKNGFIGLGDVRALGLDESHTDFIFCLQRPGFYDRSDLSMMRLAELFCIYSSGIKRSYLRLNFDYLTQAFTKEEPELK
ncbi:MAG: hypothetical protein NTY45_06435 [Elusimicrobia bacterium]|nr:hypothetical protein [Elusimicrobiota bacterium]